MSEAGGGRFFEDFALGETIGHAPSRTVTAGDVALHTALYGGRFAVTVSDPFARTLALPMAPVDDLLIFHIVFGQSVADVSVNAVANLGYADGRFGVPVYPGDTVSAASKVIGLRQTGSGDSGIVYVRTAGSNQHGETVLDYARWVLVPKADPSAPAAEEAVPELPAAVPASAIVVPAALDAGAYDATAAGAPRLWDDYEVGGRIDHVDGVTIEEAEHALATRLYHNTARVHFDARLARDGRFGRRVVYGGHVISIARALSFNGLGNAFRLVAIHGGRHVAPVFAGDTIYAWSEVVERFALAGRADIGALRLRTVALKDLPAAAYWRAQAEGGADDHPAPVLEFDYTVLMPRRGR